jgi:hypothetical protein
MSNPTLDKSKPFRVHVNHRTGLHVWEQDGKRFTEKGLLITEDQPDVHKFNCPKCDFGCENKNTLISHLMDVHHALEKTIEKEKKKMDTIEPEATTTNTKPTAEEALQDLVHNGMHKCPLCPSKFNSQQALAGHMKRHKTPA